MAITLGGIELPDSIIWVDRRNWSRVRQTKRVNLAGGVRFRSDLVTGQRPITLEARSDQGWLDDDTYIALRALEESVNETVFNFNDLEILNVVFVNYDKSALQLEPLITGDETGTRIIGTIYLETVY